jgi:hypothetical protein
VNAPSAPARSTTEDVAAFLAMLFAFGAALYTFVGGIAPFVICVALGIPTVLHRRTRAVGVWALGGAFGGAALVAVLAALLWVGGPLIQPG